MQRWRTLGVFLCVLLAGACIVAFGLALYAALAAFFCTVLVVVAGIDLERRIVPNRIIVPATAVVLAARTALDPSPEWIAAAFGAGGLLLAAARMYSGGMGMGDVKLALLLGAMLGRVVAVGLIVAIAAAGFLSAVLFARHGAKARKMAIPFAPFLAFGGVVALFWGDRLLEACLVLP